MPGPAATASVGKDLMTLLAQPAEALRDLRSEIRKAESELALLAKRGETIGEVQTKRLETLRRQEGTLQSLVTRDRGRRFGQQATKQTLGLFRGVLAAQAVRDAVRGEMPSLHAMVALAISSESRILKIAAALGGKRLSALAGKFIAGAPMIIEAMSAINDGLTKRRALKWPDASPKRSPTLGPSTGGCAAPARAAAAPA